MSHAQLGAIAACLLLMASFLLAAIGYVDGRESSQR